MCLRAIRIMVEVIVIPIFDDLDIQCSDGFIAELEAIALKSKTCKLWLDCLVKPDDGIWES